MERALPVAKEVLLDQASLHPHEAPQLLYFILTQSAVLIARCLFFFNLLARGLRCFGSCRVLWHVDSVDQWESSKFIAEAQKSERTFKVLFMDKHWTVVQLAEVLVQDSLGVHLVCFAVHVDRREVAFLELLSQFLCLAVVSDLDAAFVCPPARRVLQVEPAAELVHLLVTCFLILAIREQFLVVRVLGAKINGD